ncbi:YrzI family small protein [Anaerobacillus isosaccharinicus]|uniref:YrzI family small protein n=1 Tax=Anaerobacillus isosaccharinicus TaxID=1532552 RepID=A0A7S7L464_9BACI|nr:YrzI family small protein [Anaerobacillus isosaccharinicus]MBA5587793.1 YrzI family small protein [Anaerobacillus isosaccharinicus]QOY34050.1 YrzI family small protein [Anaerobacillus isosaccharinicus]
MVFNIFFLTITISKRLFSKADIERAYKAQISEELVEKNKQRCIATQRVI